MTALYLAVQRVHDDVVEVLLAAGADPSARATTQDGQCFSAKDVAFNNVRRKRAARVECSWYALGVSVWGQTYLTTVSVCSSYACAWLFYQVPT